ncbi:single-stranded DNA-binding protein [Pedobacter sp. UC225_65]|uniref:single-stranded DNA-binding protein n=1 Tax=Pedobacter sp. UC225_65 TaxID=3350173 RepID=UPI0036710251
MVEFSLAVNDSYRSGNERREIATFFECSYWRNEGIAEYLTKGSLIQIYGRVGVNAYLNKTGEARASLTFHVSEIKLFGSGGQSNVDKTPKTEKTEPKERENVPMEQAVAQDSAITPSTSFDDVPSVEDNLPF